MELYKKYRPNTLERVAGNAATVEILQGMVETKSVPHAMLFCGATGCGKTTIARIMAEAVGCNPSSGDLQEINCSAFRGIDTVREIESVQYFKPLAGTARVWILDEAHQFTKDAQHGLLKILEDTPDCCYFFICTTDPEKLIKPMLSRLSSVYVAPLSLREMRGLFVRVLKREKAEVPDETLDKIHSVTEGRPREALVLLEKIIHGGKPEAVLKDAAAQTETIDLCRALLAGERWHKIAKIVSGLQAEPESIRYAVLGYMRSVLLSGETDKAARAANVIVSFSQNFYDTKAAGLALAAYHCTVENS